MSECVKFNTYHSCEDNTEIVHRDKEGKEYCILHAPIEIRKNLKLENKFNQVVVQKKKMHSYNFGGCHFENIMEVGRNPLGDQWNLDFRDCIFENDLNIKGIKIGLSDFSGAHFHKAAILTVQNSTEKANLMRLSLLEKQTSQIVLLKVGRIITKSNIEH